MRADFERVSQVVDPYTADRGKLAGLMIYARAIANHFATAELRHFGFNAHVAPIQQAREVSAEGEWTR